MRCFFFFSSRRRHTRLTCDWSSDVCSSDLLLMRRDTDALQGVTMLVVTTENVPGYRVREVKGQVFGVVVRSRGLGGNIIAGLRSLVGGEIPEYTQLLEEARRHAVDRMVKNARLMQADAIVMMRFDSAEIGQTMSEIV